VTDVETSPSATSLEWIDKTSNWRMDPMSHARRFDHVGITVADLDTVTAFFVGLGLEVEGRMFVEGGTGLELSSFVRPHHEPG
jgi:hypothetical protein